MKDPGRNTRRRAAPATPLLAFVVDDASDDPEEGRAELVYAVNEADARDLALRYVSERGPIGSGWRARKTSSGWEWYPVSEWHPYKTGLGVRRVPECDRFAIRRGVEVWNRRANLEALRLAGFREDGERECCSCSLWSFVGLESSRVCDECGHDELCATVPAVERGASCILCEHWQEELDKRQREVTT